MRMSATDLDAYRYWRASEPEDEAAALADLIARLRREAPESPAMAVGKALHSALEHASPGEFMELEADGYRFQFPHDFEIALPEIREIKAEKVYVVDGIEVVMVGKVDAVEGLRVEDHKSTERFDAERFLDSYQWRVYLDIFDATHFRWNVFELQASRDEADTFEVRALHHVDQYRYPEMRADLHQAIGEFVDFARTYLPERFEDRAQRAA